MRNILFISLVIFLLACAPKNDLGSQIDAAQSQWQAKNVRSYQISVMRVNSIWHAQTNVVVVKDGAVVDKSATCVPAPFEGKTCTVQEFNADEFTIDGLFKTAREIVSQNQGNREVKITFDETFHFPATIVSDDPKAVDDDSMWRVVSFTANP
jgi:hypothetical protein